MLLERYTYLLSQLIVADDEGLYECRAENKAGSAKASKIVQLLDSAQKDALYSNISLPSESKILKLRNYLCLGTDGDGLVDRVLAFYSNDQCLNPGEVSLGTLCLQNGRIGRK